jgi:hypothetical protein
MFDKRNPPFGLSLSKAPHEQPLPEADWEKLAGLWFDKLTTNGLFRSASACRRLTTNGILTASQG